MKQIRRYGRGEMNQWAEGRGEKLSLKGERRKKNTANFALTSRNCSNADAFEVVYPNFSHIHIYIFNVKLTNVGPFGRC